MGKLNELLNKQETIILDGALGTEMEYQGYDISGELWSAQYLLNQPEVIRQIHEAYVEAGSDIITTASYQATIPGLVKADLSEEEAVDVISSTVTLAQEAIKLVWEKLPPANREGRSYPLVAGSVGPYAAYLADGSEYTGLYQVTAEDLRAFHRPRIEALVGAGADFLAIETIPNFLEVEVLVALLQEEFPAVDAYLSFTSQDGLHLSDGTPIGLATEQCQLAENIRAVGVNCTAPHLIQGLIQEMARVTDKPLMTYPNSGEIYDGQSKTWYDDPDHDHTLAENSLIWKTEGVRLFGGCCRTRPSDITELAQKLKV